LLVSSAKRFLAKPEYRIQLDELVTEETQRVLGQLDAADLSAQAPWDQAVFRARVKKYEAITEGLASTAGVLGRWGSGGDLPLVLDVIRTLYAHAEKVGGGLTAYLGLRSYPAVLVFTAYGIGTVRAGRWKVLHELFNAIIDREHRDPKRAVETLFLWEWKGNGNDVWRQMDGLDRHKTALSDYLLEVFTNWSKPFVGLVPDFEMLFERFEMLGSLAHFEKNEKPSVNEKLSMPGEQNSAWTPTGRSGWHESIATKIITEFQSNSMKARLLEAGFAKGDAGFLDLFIRNFHRIASRMSW
jgi:hypothetical protein